MDSHTGRDQRAHVDFIPHEFSFRKSFQSGVLEDGSADVAMLYLILQGLLVTFSEYWVSCRMAEGSRSLPLGHDTQWVEMCDRRVPRSIVCQVRCVIGECLVVLVDRLCDHSVTVVKGSHPNYTPMTVTVKWPRGQKFTQYWPMWVNIPH